MSDKSQQATREDVSGQQGSRRSQQFFNEPGMDGFVAVILNMASEIAVLNERVLHLEGKPEATAESTSAFVERVFAPLRNTD